MTYFQPLFSICIPTRNRAHLIGRALESCQKQSYGNIEVIVVDNCSSDDTAGIVASYRNRDSRIKFFQNDRNLGQTRNIFKAFELASGDYVQYLADDNWLEDNYAEEKLRCFSDNPGVGLVASALKKYKMSSQGLDVCFALQKKSERMDSNFVFKNFYRSDGWFGVLCTARRKDMLEALAALSNIPNRYGYDYLKSSMAYDLLPFLYILSKYPYMVYTDRTTYFDLMIPSEIEDATLTNLVTWHHCYRVAVQHTFSLCGLQSHVSACKRFFGASLAIDILKRLTFGPRTGMGLSMLPRYYSDYTVWDFILSLIEAAPILLRRVYRWAQKILFRGTVRLRAPVVSNKMLT